MKRILIVGASRGLGAAFAAGVPTKTDKVWLVSRTEPDLDACPAEDKSWVKADLRMPAEAIASIAQALGPEPIDLLIYCAGIWEEPSFSAISEERVLDIINVNLTGFVLCLHRLAFNLRQGSHTHVIAIGSTCGLENEGSDAVAYTATKFGLRGAVHSGRELLRADGVSVTCVSPGSIATDVPLSQARSSAIAKHKGARMPMHDLVALVRWIHGLEGGACPKEIDIPALSDSDV